MESENKDKEMNFFYLDDEEELKTKKAVVKKRIKKDNTKKTEKAKEIKKDDSKFSFDNEIVIGVTKKVENKNHNKKKSKSNSKNKTKSNSKTQQSKKSKNIRQNDYKNQTINEENRKEKNTKKSNIGIIIKCIILVILIAVTIILALFSPLFNIKEIKVEGNEKLTQEEIISLSRIQLEENMFKINKHNIKEQIKEDPYINTVKLVRNLPSTVILQVEERKEAYLIEYAGSYIYIDKQGYILNIGEEKIDLPILQGLSTDSTKYIEGRRLEKEDLEKLEVVYKIMDIAKNNELNSLITRVDVENIQNIKLVFETKEKTAYLGDNSNLLDKMRIIKKILEEEEGNSGEIFVNMDLNNENPIFRQSV